MLCVAPVVSKQIRAIADTVDNIVIGLHLLADEAFEPAHMIFAVLKCLWLIVNEQTRPAAECGAGQLAKRANDLCVAGYLSSGCRELHSLAMVVAVTRIVELAARFLRCDYPQRCLDLDDRGNIVRGHDKKVFIPEQWARSSPKDNHVNFTEPVLRCSESGVYVSGVLD